jgi:hypothetical protein
MHFNNDTPVALEVAPSLITFTTAEESTSRNKSTTNIYMLRKTSQPNTSIVSYNTSTPRCYFSFTISVGVNFNPPFSWRFPPYPSHGTRPLLSVTTRLTLLYSKHLCQIYFSSPGDKKKHFGRSIHQDSLYKHFESDTFLPKKRCKPNLKYPYVALIKEKMENKLVILNCTEPPINLFFNQMTFCLKIDPNRTTSTHKTPILKRK